VWHFYNVHIKTFNKSIFTGKLTRHQMEHEHGAELAQIEQGLARPAPRSEALRRRERIFIPVALVIALVGVLFVYWFATFEQTAIATLPSPVTSVPVFAPLTPTPVPTRSVPGHTKIGVSMKHEVSGKEQCDTCHAAGGISPMPAGHEGRPVESCLICHRPARHDPRSGEDRSASRCCRVVPHGLEGKEQCDTCHAGQGSLVPVPADHAGRANNTCTAAQAGRCSDPVAGATAAPPGGEAKAIPANHAAAPDAFKDCVSCTVRAR